MVATASLRFFEGRAAGGRFATVTRGPGKGTKQRDATTERRTRMLRQCVPHLAQRKYRFTVKRYASLTALFELQMKNVREHGITNELNEPQTNL